MNDNVAVPQWKPLQGRYPEWPRCWWGASCPRSQHNPEKNTSSLIHQQRWTMKDEDRSGSVGCLPHHKRAIRVFEPHRIHWWESFRWRARCSGRSRETEAASCWWRPCWCSSPDDCSSHSTPSMGRQDHRGQRWSRKESQLEHLSRHEWTGRDKQSKCWRWKVWLWFHIISPDRWEIGMPHKKLSRTHTACSYINFHSICHLSGRHSFNPKLIQQDDNHTKIRLESRRRSPLQRYFIRYEDTLRANCFDSDCFSYLLHFCRFFLYSIEHRKGTTTLTRPKN